jgi:hypothetical protein
MAADERLDELAHDRREPFCTAYAVGLGSRRIRRRREQRNGGSPLLRTDPPARVLVVQVETVFGRVPIPYGLERTAFRRGERTRIAVHVDADGVAPCMMFGAIRIEHRHSEDGQPVAPAAHALVVGRGCDVGEQIGECPCGCRFVPVHL